MPRLITMLLSSAAIILCCFSCSQDTKIIEGNLYFPFLNIGSFYGIPDSLIQKAKLYIDTVHTGNLDSAERRTFDMYVVLKKNDLLYSPFINIKLDDDSVLLLYMNEKDYNKLTIYHHKDLGNEHKKIRIKFSAQPLQYNMYLCKSLLSVNKVDGKTGMQSRKLLIEDYH